MQFLYPNVLLFMLIPTLFLLYLLATNKKSFLDNFSKEAISKLTVSTNALSKKARNFMLFIALILMIFALARPVIDLKEQEIEQELVPVVLAIDVSKSMLAKDLYPNRLEFSKNKILEYLKKSDKNIIGILLFAKSSYILSPLTKDFVSLSFLVKNLDTGLNFDNGSNILGMLEATNKLLKNYSSKNLVILSDGGNSKSYEKELEYAKDNNIKIYSIAIANKEPVPIPKRDGGFITDSNGNIVTVKFNDAIIDLSKDSGGGFIDYTFDTNDIETILNDINQNAKKESVKSQKLKIYTELFYYPLSLALFVLLLSFSSFPRRKNA